MKIRVRGFVCVENNRMIWMQRDGQGDLDANRYKG